MTRDALMRLVEKWRDATNGGWGLAYGACAAELAALLRADAGEAAERCAHVFGGLPGMLGQTCVKCGASKYGPPPQPAPHKHEHNANRCLDDNARCCYEQPAPERDAPACTMAGMDVGCDDPACRDHDVPPGYVAGECPTCGGDTWDPVDAPADVYGDAMQQAVAEGRVKAVVDAPADANKPPRYGPCDSFNYDHTCSECEPGKLHAPAASPECDHLNGYCRCTEPGFPGAAPQGEPGYSAALAIAAASFAVENPSATIARAFRAGAAWEQARAGRGGTK
jgi:hypothetical protein